MPAIGDAKPPYTQANRGVSRRKLSANGTGNDLVQWDYTVSSQYGNQVITITTPNDYANGIYGTQTETFRHRIPAPPHGWPFGYEDARNGLIFDERVYPLNADGTRGAMLRRKLSQYEQTSNAVPPRIGLPGELTVSAYRNIRPNKEVNLILDTGGDALAKTTTYGYDTTYQLTTGLDLLSTTDSHFAAVSQGAAQTGTIDTIPGGTLVRSTETTYLNGAAYRDRNILGLATVSIIKDASGTPVAKSETSYDEPSYPLVTYTDLNNVPDYTNPETTARGNPTTIRRYSDLSTSLYLETHAQFDQCGNIVISYNERNIPSQTEFSSTYKHAYVTTATTAVPDTSGQHGSNIAFTSSNSYDPTTGLILSSTDTNGLTTYFSYTNGQSNPELMLRLLKVTRPDGGWTSYQYGDSLGNLYIYTETKQDAQRIKKSYQYFDAMGRPVRGYNFESGTNYITIDTQYDKIGRVSRVSHPYRSTLGGAINPSNNWMSTAHDALDRVTAVTFSDTVTSWTVQTEYQGVYTTVTDQAFKKRRQKVDAQGRIVRVDEPDANGYLDQGTPETPVQPTYYEYDTLGNLIHSTEGVGTQLQHRYFKYDALSRPTYERQVEQAAPHTAADPLNNQWSRRIVYDEGTSKGLMTSMYDARSIRTQYQYDQLNRLWQASYSDGTPTLTNKYDQARTGFPYNKGKLTEVSTSAADDIPQTSQIYDYDLMGRIAKQTQTVDIYNYTLRYAYDFGGQLVQQTYPSGRIVNYGYDEASRLSNINGGQGHNFINALLYTPQGTLSSATLGNDAIYDYGYNSRLQLTSLQVSRNGSVLQKYLYKYGQANVNNDSIDETRNNGQIGRIESFIGTQRQWQQRFIYDSVGRLATAGEYRGDTLQQTYMLKYRYDAFGNRFQYQTDNPNNPFTQTWIEAGEISASTNRYTSGATYDDAGNITSDARFHNFEYLYDANSRQKQSSLPGGANPVKATYDGAGNRVATKLNGVLTTVMVYDVTSKLVAEYGQQVPSTASIQYILADHQGSTCLVTDRGGNVYSRHDYQPFGEELAATVGMRSQNPGYGTADNVRQKYAGMETDDATQMSHTLWRKYDGRSGRWTSPDPYGGSLDKENPQSLNRYSYVLNDPVNRRDPDGLYPRSQHQFITFLMAAMLNVKDAEAIAQGAGDQDNFWNAAVPFIFVNFNKHFGVPKSPEELANVDGYQLGQALHLVEDNGIGGPHQLAGCNEPGCYGLGDRMLSAIIHGAREIFGDSPDRSPNRQGGWHEAWKVLLLHAPKEMQDMAYPEEVIDHITGYVNANGLTIIGMEYISPNNSRMSSGAQLDLSRYMLVSSTIVNGVQVNIYVEFPREKKPKEKPKPKLKGNDEKNN